MLTINQVLWLKFLKFYRITYSPPSRCSHLCHSSVVDPSRPLTISSRVTNKSSKVIIDKEKESFINEPKDDKPTDSGSSHKKKDGKKKRRIKKIVYYDDSDESSSQKDNNDNDYEKKKSINSNFSFDYSRIPQSSNAHLLSIPLVNLLTLMERTTDFGVTKCVVTCSLSIQVYGR